MQLHFIDGIFNDSLDCFQKLANVDAERKKWVQYREEHLQAASNLRDFQKSYRKDILVPIGPKALIPGHLYHTNEVLVGMYRGMFVNCSTDKALLVCEHRLGEAAKRLDALDTEQQMYRCVWRGVDFACVKSTPLIHSLRPKYKAEIRHSWVIN